MTPEEKLDAVLNYLSNNGAKGESYNYYKDLLNYLSENKTDIPKDECPMIVNQLIEDGYVKCYENEIIKGTEQIKITFKGKYFIGYVQQQNNKESEITTKLEDKQMMVHYQIKMATIQKWIVRATVVTGIFYLIEILKIIYHHWNWLFSLFHCH
ncbi:MAG: hypothetical protein WC223_06440 [Bacteroidales bacterium]|jgi:hypothetical protein